MLGWLTQPLYDQRRCHGNLRLTRFCHSSVRSNLYFKELTENRWRKKRWNGPMQYEDRSGTLMMLPTDMALVWCVPRGARWPSRLCS